MIYSTNPTVYHYPLRLRRDYPAHYLLHGRPIRNARDSNAVLLQPGRGGTDPPPCDDGPSSTHRRNQPRGISILFWGDLGRDLDHVYARRLHEAIDDVGRVSAVPAVLQHPGHQDLQRPTTILEGPWYCLGTADFGGCVHYGKVVDHVAREWA